MELKIEVDETPCEVIKYRLGSWMWGEDHEEYFAIGYAILQYQDILFRYELDNFDKGDQIDNVGIGGIVRIDLRSSDIEPYMINEEIIRDGDYIYNDY